MENLEGKAAYISREPAISQLRTRIREEQREVL